MKVAIFSESPADEAAIRILATGLLGSQITIVPNPRLRTRGWQAMLRILPIVIKHLYYQTDAEGLIVVMDSDASPVHDVSHNQPGQADAKCRLCEIRRITDHTLRPLKPRPFGPLRTAFGLAVPQIEAWYLLGRNPHVGESAWITDAKERYNPAASSKLKELAYGTSRPSLEAEMEIAVKQAQRIVQEGLLADLKQ
jgi:hypothetical protein